MHIAGKFSILTIEGETMDRQASLGYDPVENRLEILAERDKIKPQISGFHHVTGAETAAVCPTVNLRITSEDFAPDFFWETLYFVSARFRAVAQLDSTVATFQPVNARQSADAARAQDYCVWFINPVRDWVDTDKSALRWMTFPDGKPYVVGYENIIFRDDVEPDVDVFHTPVSRETFATRDFVERIRGAGLTGIDFKPL